MKVNSSIIRIVGLLGEIPEKSADKLFQKFRDAGYHRDLYPVDTNGAKDGRSLQFLKDYFYPNFRNLMFLKDNEDETFRYIKLDNRTVSLTYGRDERKRIFLPDFGNIEIKLRPLEKTLYLFYLNHPEGVGLSFLRGKREELYEIYTSLSSIGNLQEMKNRIDEMANITSNSAAEKISKIKKAFVKAIGEELAKNYYIQGGNGEVKKVILDRHFLKIKTYN